MSARLARVFKRCKEAHRAALVGYLTAGDPNPEQSQELLLSLAAECDIIEIGMPFSDPMADGPVIEAASERALAAGTHIQDVFHLSQAVRLANPEIGIILMGYANVPYVMGFERFAERAEKAGVDGVLIVDIPPEEGAICDEALKAHNLDRILLLSPTSPDERIHLACAKGSGFIYYVSLTGITGAEMGDIIEIQNKVAHIQSISEMPVCVGFGIKTAAQAAAVGRFADGVVVGSHFVNQIASQQNHHQSVAALSATAMALRAAMHREINAG
ncbi:MAG: tryptophan synthase subunit alpha [Mariprofundus sp.]|nr:tryptophan synthase subunit alpha [Mariprofundus sp.]